MKKAKEGLIAVKQVEGKEVTIEVLAQSITDISTGIKKLRSGRLNDRALLLLIQNAAPSLHSGRYSYKPVPIKTIQHVLNGIENLEAEYLKKK